MTGARTFAGLVATLAGWALIPVLLLMQFFDLRRGLVGPGWLWSAHLFGFGLLVLVGLPLAWRARGQLSSLGWISVALFTALVGYAAASVLLSGTPLVTSRTTPTADPPNVFAFPRLEHRLVPLLTAWLTMAAGVVTVLVMPRGRRWERLWWAAVLLLVTSAVAWPRSVVLQGSSRLATGMGGSAIIHLVFLLCLGVFAGAVWEGFRRRASLAGGLVALVFLLMTGSRAGLAALAVFLVLALAHLGRRVSPKLAAAGLAGVALTAAAVIWLTPAGRRLLDLGDDLRRENLRTAWSVVSHDPQRIVLGLGSGRLWPWYAFDARFFRTPHRGVVASSAGRVLTNPHSVLLGVGVELGLVGLVLLGGFLGLLIWRAGSSTLRRVAVGSALGTRRSGLALALLAGLATFLVDYYLLKNFSVSYWWWVCWTMLFIQPDRRDV